ncbi:RepB family plasmid replication initiator protein, partial [Acinetobacter baumannii]|nr:RepB family plasmid replication initiator protein [Acinetobacter baumannii]
EMGRYSQGTESYQQFAVRIAEMLQDPAQFKELYPYLKKVGYMPSNKKDTVNG